MLDEPHPRHRPRPLGVAQVEALAGEVEGLAKRWLLELIASASLEEAARLPLAELAAGGPRVIEVVVRALGDEAALARVERGEPAIAGLAALTGARDAAEVSRAVDALHAVLWSAALDALGRAIARDVVELAERLTLVVATLRAVALDGLAASAAPARAGEPEAAREPEATPEPEAAPQPDAAREPEAAPQPDTAPDRFTPADLAAALRGLSGDRAAAAPSTPADHATLVSTLENEIHRARLRAERLAVVVIELEEAERLLAAAADQDRDGLLAAFTVAVRRVLRPGDILAPESASRAWIIARDTGRASARELAGRVAGALGEGAPWRGAPLRVSAGVALLGEDGSSPGALIDAAEVGRFAAAAAGVTVVGE